MRTVSRQTFTSHRTSFLLGSCAARRDAGADSKSQESCKALVFDLSRRETMDDSIIDAYNETKAYAQKLEAALQYLEAKAEEAELLQLPLHIISGVCDDVIKPEFFNQFNSPDSIPF